MRKLTTATIIACSMVTSVFCQEEIHFKQEYKPGYQYHMLSIINRHTETLTTGPDSLLQDMKTKGQDPKAVSDQVIQYDADMKTSATRNVNGELDFQMKINRAIVANDSSTSGLELFGRYTGKGLKVDSIYSDKISGAMGKQIGKLFEKMLGQITTPDTILKKGDSFMHDFPVNIPVNDKMATMHLITTYTLISIEKGFAHISTSQTVKLESPDQTILKNLTGEGDGELVYDINNSMYTKYMTDFRMHLKRTGKKIQSSQVTELHTEQTMAIRSK